MKKFNAKKTDSKLARLHQMCSKTKVGSYNVFNYTKNVKFKIFGFNAINLHTIAYTIKFLFGIFVFQVKYQAVKVNKTIYILGYFKQC